MKTIAATVSVLLASLFAAQASAGTVVGNTTILQNVPTKVGFGPYHISDDGNCSIDSSVLAFNSLTFSATDPNGNPVAGTVNLPNGNPTPGGGAVNWTGNLSPVTVKGTYTVIVIMTFTDANRKQQIYRSTVNFPIK
jgi:hypothetical protein